MSQINEHGFTKEISTILFNLFKSCDDTNSGCVRVSTLIAKLKEKTGGTEIYEYLNDLSKILDCDGVDPCIIWSFCEIGIHQWIQWIQKINQTSTIERQSLLKSPAKTTSRVVSTTKSPKVLQLSGSSSKKFVNGVSTYSNDSMDASELSWDNNDIHIKLEELEITNKRLLEDNLKLKKHLDSTEDQNSSVLQENDSLKMKINKYEKLLDESKSVAKSYEELKGTVLEYHTFKNDLVEKTCQLEKENTCLQIALNDYEQKVTQLDMSVDQLQNEKDRLTKDLYEQKQLLNKIDELSISREDLVEEVSGRSEYMSSVIAELSLANEVLKAQKGNLENEVSDLKQELSRISVFSRFDIMSTPLLSSTKCEKWPTQSLHLELKAEETAFHDLFDASPVKTEQRSMNGANDLSISFNNISPPDQFVPFAQQCREKIIEKKELIFDKIEEIVHYQQDTNASKNKEKTSIIFDDLNKDFESFTEKIAELAQEKQTAEIRTAKMAEACRKLQEDNKFLEESRGKALQKFGDLSITSIDLEEQKLELLSQLKRKDELVDSLQHELVDLKKQIADLEQEVMEEKYRLNEGAQSNINQTMEDSVDDFLHQQIVDLKSLIKDLESRNMNFAREVFDLEEQLSSKEDMLTDLKNKLHVTQLSLSSQESAYSKGIKSLLEIIPSEKIVFTNGELSCECVKEKLLQFIMKSKKDTNRFMGLRESPDGGPRTVDNNNNNITTDHIKRIARISRDSSYNQSEHRETSSQTDLDMLSMAKLLEAYELLPNALERKVPERLQKHNSLDHLKSQAPLLDTSQIIRSHIRNSSPTEYSLDLPISNNRVLLEKDLSNQDQIDSTSISNNCMLLEKDLSNQDQIDSTSISNNCMLLEKDLSNQDQIDSTSISNNCMLLEKDLSNQDQIDSTSILYNSDERCEELKEQETERDSNCQDTTENDSGIHQSDDVALLNEKYLFSESGKELIEATPHCDEAEKSRKLSENTSLSSFSLPQLFVSFEDTPEDFHDTDNIICEDDREQANHVKQAFNSKIASIVEFDRSDISSDSEAELNQRRKASARRTRFSGDKKKKTNSLAQDSENIEQDDGKLNEHNMNRKNTSPRRRQRRIGVSAEPVRVSWRSLRESYKQLQQQEFNDIIDRQSSGDTLNNDELKDQDLLEEEDGYDVEQHQLTLSAPLPSSLPIIEVEEEKSDSLSNDVAFDKNEDQATPVTENDAPTDNDAPTVSKKHSLQVPEQSFRRKSLPKLSQARPDYLNTENSLEKKFNNVVFSFKTDQYTLQKRLENQERARDVAESSMDKELTKLDSFIKKLNTYQIGTRDYEEAYQWLLRQSEVLRKAAMKISAQSEQHGCYQQENNTVPNIEILIEFVDHLRAQLNKLSDDYDECRKRLQNYEDRSSEYSDSGQNSFGYEKHVTQESSCGAEKITGSADNENSVAKPRQSFSSISKSVILAQGISRLRNRQKKAMKLESSPIQKKHVSFGEVERVQTVEPPVLDVSDIESDSYSDVTIPNTIRSITYKLFVAICIFSLVSFLFFIILSVLEIDTLKLHDNLLRYVPYTVERTDKER